MDERRTSQQITGHFAENLACVYLQSQNVVILDRNYRCRRGEIDVVAREAETLIFLEVRFRKSNRYGGAAASITKRKQLRTILAAQRYLQQKGLTNMPCRFDVVAIDGNNSVNWIKHAYSL